MNVKESITPEQLAAYTELVKDMKKLRKESTRKEILEFVFGSVIFALLIGAGVYLAVDGVERFALQPPFPVKEGWGFLYAAAALLFVYVATMLHVYIHEAGHLVFGLLTGYRFSKFTIFSFIFKPIPPEWKDGEKYPYVWYCLGGVVFNVIASLLAVLLFSLHIPLVSWITAVFIFIGVLMAICRVVPLLFESELEGTTLRLCKQSRENQKNLYMQMKITALKREGVALKDMPEEFFAVEADEKMNPLNCHLALLKYYRYIQTGEGEKAREWLKAMEQQMDYLSYEDVQALDMERLFLCLKDGGSIEEIAAYYSLLETSVMKSKRLSNLRVRYAYHVLLTEEEREKIEWLVASCKGKLPDMLWKRKRQKAEKIYKKMEKACAKYPVSAEAEFYMDMVKDL